MDLFKQLLFKQLATERFWARQFKHGFGKPDMGELTPTEELRGAAILNENEWLEPEIFEGRGTRYPMPLSCRAILAKKS
jgi:hypothetical protein